MWLSYLIISQCGCEYPQVCAAATVFSLLFAFCFLRFVCTKRIRYGYARMKWSRRRRGAKNTESVCMIVRVCLRARVRMKHIKLWDMRGGSRVGGGGRRKTSTHTTQRVCLCVTLCVCWVGLSCWPSSFSSSSSSSSSSDSSSSGSSASGGMYST